MCHLPLQVVPTKHLDKFQRWIFRMLHHKRPMETIGNATIVVWWAIWLVRVPTRKLSHKDGEATEAYVSVVLVESPTNEWKQWIEELRQELQKAELEEAMDEATPAAHNVSLTPGASNSTLWPSAIVKLGVNGVVTDVLVNTGSPIVSLKFILKILADSKGSEQTVQEWREMSPGIWWASNCVISPTEAIRYSCHQWV